MAYRKAWGNWVAERLELIAFPLRGSTVEIHAGAAYINALRRPFEAHGATLLEPLRGLPLGQRLSWYRNVGGSPNEHRFTVAPGGIPHDSTETVCDKLTSVADRLRHSEFLARGPAGLKVPGLYSWSVDQTGATDLAAGLGLPVQKASSTRALLVRHAGPAGVARRTRFGPASAVCISAEAMSSRPSAAHSARSSRVRISRGSSMSSLSRLGCTSTSRSSRFATRTLTP